MTAISSDERPRIRSRIRRFYQHFNRQEWHACFDLLDPALRDGRVDAEKYCRGLKEFFAHYGPVTIRKVQDLKVIEPPAKRAAQHIAYALVIWHDKHHEPHLFKERWTKSDGRWYTRVAGLVIPQSESPPLKESGSL